MISLKRNTKTTGTEEPPDTPTPSLIEQAEAAVRTARAAEAEAQRAMQDQRQAPPPTKRDTEAVIHAAADYDAAVSIVVGGEIARHSAEAMRLLLANRQREHEEAVQRRKEAEGEVQRLQQRATWLRNAIRQAGGALNHHDQRIAKLEGELRTARQDHEVAVRQRDAFVAEYARTTGSDPS